MTQQSHCWAYKPGKPELKETRPTVTPGEQGVLLAGAGGRKNLQILGEGRCDGEGTLHLEPGKAPKAGVHN